MFVFRNQSFVERENAAQGGIDFPRKLAGIRAHHFGTGVQATRSKSSSAPYTALAPHASHSYRLASGSTPKASAPQAMQKPRQSSASHASMMRSSVMDGWSFIRNCLSWERR